MVLKMNIENGQIVKLKTGELRTIIMVSKNSIIHIEAGVCFGQTTETEKIAFIKNIRGIISRPTYDRR